VAAVADNTSQCVAMMAVTTAVSANFERKLAVIVDLTWRWLMREHANTDAIRWCAVTMALVWLISTSVPPVFKAVTPSAPNVRKKMGPCVVLMAFSMKAVVISGKRPANKEKLLAWLTEANVL